jgi:hypothetical protein
MAARLQRDRELRVWHVGHEDGTQTFFLAALLDRAAARSGAAGLAVDLLATDVCVRLGRKGRALRLVVDGVPRARKRPLLLSDLGAVAQRDAAKEVAALEGSLPDPVHTRRYRAHLKKLADAGAVAVYLEGYLGLGHRCLAIRDHRWRLCDHENGGVLNPAVNDRTMRFCPGDVSRQHPSGGIDLAVCTHVLAHLRLYETHATREDPLPAAFTHLLAALRPGGILVLEEGCGNRTRWGERMARAFDDAVGVARARQVTVLVTRGWGLQAR